MMNKKMNAFLGWVVFCMIILLYILPYFIPKIISSISLLVILIITTFMIILGCCIIAWKPSNFDYNKIINQQPDIFSKNGIWFLIILSSLAFLDKCWAQYQLILQSLKGEILHIETKYSYWSNYLIIFSMVFMLIFYINLLVTGYKRKIQQ